LHRLAGLQMYPYHLADIFVDELNTTTFAYYHLILCDMVSAILPDWL